MRFQPLSLALAVSLAFAAPAMSADAPNSAATVQAVKLSTVEGITEYSLPNGMHVLLAPDASKPTTTVNLTFLVGSRHENYGETGMAHLLEHMTYKGTPKHGNIMQELGRRGMDFNGSTFMDRTNYFETFPASNENLAWALEMEADRMINSTISREDLDKEFSVVRNEMEKGENAPRLVLWKQLTAVSYDWHNYGHNTIGARSDVENVKIENLQAFYRKYYQPDNAVLVVTGKFDPSATLALIERHFGSIAKPARVLAPTYTLDAPRDGAREVTVNRIADTQLVAAMYPTAPGAHPDSVAVSALGEILGNTPNGRLYRNLVTSKKAAGADAWAFSLAEPGYIIFWSQLSKTQSIAEARKILLATVEGVKAKPITAAELERAKATMLNDIDKTINDAQQLGLQLSESIAKGDWRLFFLDRDRIEALTVADVQRVAENYFRESNRTFGQFVPTKSIERAAMPALPDVAKMVDGYKGRAAVAEGEVFDVSPANIESRTQRLALANGMKVALTAKKTRANAVAGQIVLEFGDEKTLFGQNAVADMTGDMLARGSNKMSRADITAKLDALKAKLSIYANGQNVTVDFDTVRKNLPQVLSLVREVLRTPSFPAPELEALRSENLTNLEAGRNEPAAIGERELRRATNQFKKGDIRYVSSMDELAVAYKKVTLAELKRFHADMYGANHGHLALVGDFDPKEVQAQLASAFGDWNSRAKFTRLANPLPQVVGAQRQIETADKANAVYLSVLPMALADGTPDAAALVMANEVLGGGTESRLMTRLRQKDGLSYGAGSALRMSNFEANASLGMEAIYAPQNLDKIKQDVREELERLVKDGITEKELADAKASLMQQRQTTRAQDAALAAGMVGLQKAGRTMQFSADSDARILALTLEQVNAAIKKYIDPSKFVHIYAGDFAGAAKAAAAKPVLAPAAK
ncbi:MAG: pitrilysin family protein [Pseudomonadota bacterium]